MLRIVGFIIGTSGKGIVEYHTSFRDAEVQAMHATFRTIHTTALGSVTIVQELGRETSQGSTFGSLEHKRRHTGTILSEIYNQSFTRLENHFFTLCIFLTNNYLAVCILCSSFYTLPKISLDRRQSQILTEIDFSSGRRKNFALELGIQFRCLHAFYGSITHRFTSIVGFTIEDSRMLHRTGDTSFPVFQIGTIELLATIGIGEFQHTTEGTLLAQESFMTMRSNNLVGPPTRSDLCRELVFGTCLGLEGIGYIVSERTAGLGIMRIARLHEFLAYRLSVDIDFVHTETSSHPLGRNHLLLVLYHRHEPAGTIGRTVVLHITSLACNHRSIDYRNPLGRFPSRGIECLGPFAIFFGSRSSTSGEQHQTYRCNYVENRLYIHKFFILNPQNADKQLPIRLPLPE